MSIYKSYLMPFLTIYLRLFDMFQKSKKRATLHFIASYILNVHNIDLVSSQ